MRGLGGLEKRGGGGRKVQEFGEQSGGVGEKQEGLEKYKGVWRKGKGV